MKEFRVASVSKMDALIPLMKEMLASGKSVLFSPSGVSMLPMLRQGIDSVELSPVPGVLKKYDLPLYQRDNGKYILHRIVAVDETYTCIGDNQYITEKGVRQDQLIAVVTAFYRGEKRHSVKNPFYKVYCRIWHHSRCVRHFWVRSQKWLRRHLT